MSFDLASLTRAVAGHGAVVRVAVAQAQGSAPRGAGTAMLVWADGQSGTIGGGTLEFDAAAQARTMIAEGRDRMALRLPLGPALGQCCGGAVVLVLERFTAQSLPAPENGVFVRRIEGEAEAPLDVRRLQSVARGQGLAPPVTWARGWLVEPVTAEATPLWIWGAGHVGRALVSVIAPLPDFAITWVDEAPNRFPDNIPEGVRALPAPDMGAAVAMATKDAHHLVLTYSHAIDLDLCHRLLGHGFASAGLIGSATKWARFRSRLAALGHESAQISRICCPIGRPELGKHPQAIAVGVATSLISGQKASTNRKGATG